MGDPRGFLTLHRIDPRRRPVEERIHDWRELYHPLPEESLRAQGARCMDCGVPFCQSDTGCPVQNIIPDWNDLVFRGRWEAALDSLHRTNNFPEFTGRLCPAPCETACVLGIIDAPVAIRNIEQAIIDRGWDEGWVAPLAPTEETGKTVAVVGSGPAGLAAAQQLRRLGHQVVVLERADRIGGLLRYGIPEFKMEKWVLERRLRQMVEEGVVFRTSTAVGSDLSVEQLFEEFDAVCLATGAMVARDLPIAGRDLDGVHLAMDYLTQANRVCEGDEVPEQISADGKVVVVIGGGDTGSDCVGTARRQGAAEVYQFELLPQPPEKRADSTPWPLWPMQLRTSHAHEEGCEREWSVSTTAFAGHEGRVTGLHAVRVESKPGPDGRSRFEEVPGSAFDLQVDLVVLAMGFTGPERHGLLDDLGVMIGPRGSVEVDRAHMTSVPGIFAAGDAKRGASLIVWAIREGRDAAAGIDAYLCAGGSLRREPRLAAAGRR
jgi:glutamate synthase (NADPH) small chain